MVLTPSEAPKNGFVRPNELVPGMRATGSTMPLVYNRVFLPDEFLGRTVLLPGTDERARVSAVFRTPRDAGPWLLVDAGGAQRELPLLRSCVEEADPFRDAAGLTREQRHKNRAERERRLMQAQLHEPPKLEAGAKAKAGASAGVQPAAKPSVDPSLEMWTRPQQ
jgi:hypothetical protein